MGAQVIFGVPRLWHQPASPDFLGNHGDKVHRCRVDHQNRQTLTPLHDSNQGIARLICPSPKGRSRITDFQHGKAMVPKCVIILNVKILVVFASSSGLLSSLQLKLNCGTVSPKEGSESRPSRLERIYSNIFAVASDRP